MGTVSVEVPLPLVQSYLEQVIFISSYHYLKKLKGGTIKTVNYKGNIGVQEETYPVAALNAASHSAISSYRVTAAALNASMKALQVTSFVKFGKESQVSLEGIRSIAVSGHVASIRRGTEATSKSVNFIFKLLPLPSASTRKPPGNNATKVLTDCKARSYQIGKYLIVFMNFAYHCPNFSEF